MKPLAGNVQALQGLDGEGEGGHRGSSVMARLWHRSVALDGDLLTLYGTSTPRGRASAYGTSCHLKKAYPLSLNQRVQGSNPCTPHHGSIIVKARELRRMGFFRTAKTLSGIPVGVTIRVTATTPASSLKALSMSTSHRRHFNQVAGLAPAPATEASVLACALSRCFIRPVLMSFGLMLPASPLEGAAILWHVRRQRCFCGRLTIRDQGNGHLAGDLQFA